MSEIVTVVTVMMSITGEVVAVHAIHATDTTAMVMIVEAGQTRSNAAADVVPHLMGVHRVTVTGHSIRTDGPVGNPVIVMSPRAGPVSHAGQALMSVMARREISTLTLPCATDVMRMLRCTTRARALSGVCHMPGVPAGETARRTGAAPRQMAAMRCRAAQSMVSPGDIATGSRSLVVCRQIASRMTTGERRLRRVLVVAPLETATAADAAAAHPAIEVMALVRGTTETLVMSTHLLTAEMVRRGAVMMGATTKTRMVAAAESGMMTTTVATTAKVMATAATHMMPASTEPASSVMTAPTSSSMTVTCRQI